MAEYYQAVDLQPPDPASLPKPSFTSAPFGKSSFAKPLGAKRGGGAKSGSAPASVPRPQTAPAPKKVAAAAAETLVEQWANGLVGVSSQFSTSDNSARQLLGKHTVYPQFGPNVRAWSPVPRAGHSREWVRLLYRQPVVPASVVVFQSFNPGSLIEVRGAAEPIGADGADSEWVTLWCGERYNTDPNRQACDALELKIAPGDAPPGGIRVLELALDTTGWSEDFWSELDAVKLLGVSAVSVSGNVIEVVPRAYITKQLSETPKSFRERAAWVRKPTWEIELTIPIPNHPCEASILA